VAPKLWLLVYTSPPGTWMTRGFIVNWAVGLGYTSMIRCLVIVTSSPEALDAVSVTEYVPGEWYVYVGLTARDVPSFSPNCQKYVDGSAYCDRFVKFTVSGAQP